MPTPEIHASTTFPLAVLSVSTFVTQLIGLPKGAIVMAIAGAVWAIWRNDTFTRRVAFIWWIGGVVAALGLTSGTAELLNFMFGFNPPLQWLSGLIAFIFIDKPARDKLFGWLAAKADSVEVKK